MRSMPFIVNVEVRNVWPRRVGDARGGEYRESGAERTRGAGEDGSGHGNAERQTERERERERKAEESGERSLLAALEGR